MDIVIVGQERSGTTVLRSIIEELGYENIHEPFNPSNKTPFKKFVHDQDGWWEFHNLPDQFSRYLDETKEKTGKPIILDVKYAWLDLFPSFPFLPLKDRNKPSLVSYFSSRNILPIHVNRWNKLERIVSEELALSTGLWHRRTNEEISFQKITLGCDELIAKIEFDLASSKAVSKLLSDIQVLEINYENDILPLSLGRKEVLAAKLEEVGLSLNDDNFSPTINKSVTQKYREIIENFFEVKELIKGSQFEWMIQGPEWHS